MSDKKPFNIWPWIPAIVLSIVVVVNIVFINLAIEHRDVRVDQPGEATFAPSHPAPADAP